MSDYDNKTCDDNIKGNIKQKKERKSKNKSVDINKNENKEFKYPEFDDIEVSTMTIVCITNWLLNIQLLFDNLETTPYTVIPKKRGRKPKNIKEEPHKNLPEGSIINMRYKDQIKGVVLREKKGEEKSNYFRNALTIVMFVDNKMINMKISKNGKFQITGCKTYLQAEMCVKYMWDYINQIEKVSTDEAPRVFFITVMTNIDFNLGFLVNRENLDKYINKNTDYNSLLETSFGYTGVNIKIPLKIPEKLKLKTITLYNESWIEGEILYSDYVNSLEKVEKTKELAKKRWYTFLVFQSGNVIFSCMSKECFMKEIYEEFLTIIKDCKYLIEEKIEDKVELR